jgi:DNA-binding winged helix-turn-helix (wHTH) protein
VSPADEGTFSFPAKIPGLRSTHCMRVRFAGCVLDSETRELLVHERRVHLSPKGFQFLEVLLENRPRALSKEEIHSRLWPETFVSDATVTSLLAEVRAAIGDGDRDPQCIRTVHRFGYAFSGDVSDAAGRNGRHAGEKRVYRLLWGRREIALQEGENFFGRDPHAVAWINSERVSRRHARILISAEEAVIEDLGSKNGTYLRGERVQARSTVRDGDEIRIGPARLTFRVFSIAESTDTDAKREEAPAS